MDVPWTEHHTKALHWMLHHMPFSLSLNNPAIPLRWLVPPIQATHGSGG